MRRIYTFKEVEINESSAAGNNGQFYSIPFKYTSNDPKNGYNSKTFVDDLKSIFIEKPKLEKEITEFLVANAEISRIDDLSIKPFSLISKLIPEIERIIEAGEYEPEMTMPGGGLLFIRNKTFKDGSGADFYINKKGTKIEVVLEDDMGKDKVALFTIDNFPFDRFEFTEEEKEELEALIKAKGSNS
jgi:hypothetical protein